jgi:HD-like signal output (HDOD) protein
MSQHTIALGRDELVGPDPNWEQLSSEERHRWLTEIEDFPPPPLLLELMDRDLHYETYDPAKLAQKLSADSVITGRLLGRANSAVFAPVEPVTSLKQALVMLGFNLARSIVLNYQVEQSALRLEGIVREHIIEIQRSTGLGSVIAYNWASEARLPDPSSVATLCMLGRLGTFLLARRYPRHMRAYFDAGHEPQRLNYEANTFGVTSRSLTFKVGQWWGLPEPMLQSLFNIWTPLFADWDDPAGCVACAAVSLSFDPPQHMDDLQKWLGLRVHQRLKNNLQQAGALKRLPDVLDSTAYQNEIAAIEEGMMRSG